MSFHISKEFCGIAFSDPQQFSELENFDLLGAGEGGGVHDKVSWPIDYYIFSQFKDLPNTPNI